MCPVTHVHTTNACWTKARYHQDTLGVRSRAATVTLRALLGRQQQASHPTLKRAKKAIA